jgi:hypothetical protein
MKTFIMIFVIIFSLKSFPQNSTITVKSKINYLLGLALGNPNDVNAVGGLYYKNYGIKISGGAWLIKKIWCPDRFRICTLFPKRY